jgi:translocation and assembly module TamB
LAPITPDTPAAKPEKPTRNRRRLWLRWLIGLLLLPFLLVALVLLLLYVPPVQHFVRGKAVDILTERIGTRVELERFHLRFPLGVRLKGLYVEDQQGDTLLYAGRINTRVGLRKLIGGHLLLDPVELSDVRATLHQDADSTFNFDFIINAFVGDDADVDKAPKDTTGGIDFGIGTVRLQRIHFNMRMEPGDLSLDLRLGELALDFDRFTLDPLAFHVDQLVLKDTRLDLRSSSGEPTPPKYPDLEGPLADIDVRFQGIQLENVAFTMKTTDTGDSLWLAVDRAGLKTRSIDLTQQQLALKRFDIDGLDFGLLGMTRDVLPDTLPEGDPLWLDQGDGFRFWTQDWDLSIDQLRIAHSSIALHTDSIASPALLFDPAHMVYTDITIDANDMAVNNGRIALGLEKLLVHGGPDHTPLALSLDLEARPDSITLRDGDLQAMGNAFQFTLAAQPGDLSAVHRDLYEVPIQVEARTALRMADLIPLLDGFGVDLPRGAAADERWDTRVWLSGTPRRADRMGLQLTGDQGSSVKLEGSTRQADRWPHNNFELQLDELVMGRGMYQVARAFSPPDLTLPQRLTLRGNASGEAGTVRTVIAMDSDLGRITGFAVVNDWSGNMPDGLDLALTMKDLQVGTFIGDTLLDPISLKVVAGGTRLNHADRSGSLNVIPEVLVYQENDLSSLRVSATVQGDSIRLDLSVNADPAHVLLTAQGSWPREGDSLATDLDLIVQHLRFEDLGLVEHPIHLAGRIRGRAAFTTNGNGRVDLRGTGMQLDNDHYSFVFDRFALKGLLDTDSMAVELDSDAFTLNYHSNLGIDSIVPHAQAKLLSFFQEEGEYVPQPGRRMDLAITLPRTDWLTEIIVPGLDAIELRTFSGSYDSDDDVLKLDIDIPHVDYDGIDLHGLTVDVEAVENRLNGALRLVRIERDSLYLENIALETSTAADALHTTFRMHDGEQDIYRIGTVLRREDKVPVLSMADEFLLNNRTWTAHPENALYLASEGLRAEQFELQSNGERIALRTGTRRNHIEITAFRLNSITELINSGDTIPFVDGVMDGTISLPFVEEGRLEADITLAGLSVQGVEVGTLKVKAAEFEGDRYRGQLDLSSPGNSLAAKVEADLSGDAPSISADAMLDIGDLRFLKPFVREYLYTIEGGVTGSLRYRQNGDDISATGRLTFNEAGIGVIQTGSTYRLPKETIVLDDRGLLLERITVLDSADNRFRVDGRILTAAGKLPELDLRLRTQRFQLVNSTIDENPMFFGDLFGSIDLRISGTAISPVVRGDVGILDGTRLSIVLPGSRVELIEHEGIVLFTEDFDAKDTLFVNADSEMLRDSLAAQLPGVELDLRIRLDKRATFAVVIDPTTGDEATFSGEADLVFRYSPDGDIHLTGPFIVGEGGYTLEFYGLVKKRFELVPGGTVIWDGDLMRGRMDIQARYRSETAPFALVAGAGGGVSESERNRLQQRLPFDVMINIGGAVNAPEITFGLELDRMSRNSFPQVSNRLDQLAQAANEEELNRQVFGLLVLNTFIQDEGAGGQPSSGLATTAARNSVNALLTDQLNRLTGQVVRGMDIQLGVNTYDQAQDGDLYQRTTVDYRVSQRLLNDRVTIEAGGSLGLDEREQDVSNLGSTRAAQYAILYDVTRDGRLRLRAFHELAFDLYDGEIFNNGIAIMLTREFEENARDRERRREAIRRERQAGTKEEE